MKLSKDQKKILLKIARMSIENYLNGIKDIDYDAEDNDLNSKSGVFVTLHENGNLRGCIGNITSKIPLWITINSMAKEAAFHDPRFYPLTKKELRNIEIEISVLSPLKKISSIDEITVGKHGLVIKSGYYQGLLLPQVATEYQWGKIEFLEHSCSKAGLPKGCWKEKDTEIYIFSAVVFSEKEIGDL